jgi:hypothetical protein
VAVTRGGQQAAVSEKRRRATRGTVVLVQKAGLHESMRERTMEEGEGGAERRQGEMKRDAHGGAVQTTRIT